MKHRPVRIIFKIVLLCFVCISNALWCVAQKNDFVFPPAQILSTNQGLSNNNPTIMMQDSKGFIWIATNYGLNRYDGYNFEVYNYDAADTNSISPGWYRALFEDKNGMIWTCSGSEGIFAFDPKTEKFKRYYHQHGNSNSIAGAVHEANMVQDTSGIIWIGTVAGLNSFDPIKNKFELYTHRENDSTSLSSNNILWVCVDDENNLWVSTSANCIDVFNISTKKVTARFSIGSEQMPGNKSNPVMNNISKGKNGNIWIGSQANGLYNYNTKTKQWKHFYNEAGNNFSLKEPNIYDCMEVEAGNVFMAGYRNGLYYYQSNSGKFYFTDFAEMNFTHAEISSFMKDESGKLWMSCGDIGILTMDPTHKNIKSVRAKKNDNNSLRSDDVIGFYHSQQNDLFINAFNGIYKFNNGSKTIQPFKIIENGKNLFDDTFTWMIRQDNKGIFWFCTLDGLISYDGKTGKHHYYQHNENDSTSIGENSATSFVQDNNGKYWFTTFGGGLNLFNPETGKFKAYKLHDGKNSISTNFTNGIYKDSKGIIYIGSWYGGLIQFDPSTETFKNYLHHPSDTNSISCNITWPLYDDSNGFIWVGTIGGGLNVFNPATGKFKAFTMKDGLPSNAVVSLVIDDAGKAWLGTYHGIASCTLPQNPFDKNCKINFRNYDMSDGLPSNDCYFLGAHKERDGTLFFSTNTGGFFYFKPDELKENSFIPPIYITGFSLMNKEVSPKDSNSVLKTQIEFTKEIFLNYNQNILSFTFAALNFIHPEKNKYAYKLENYDKDWIYTDASKRFASYTNLDPGTYVFKVKGSNNDGVWNETPTELTIIISPPFWKTVWFRILAVAALAAALYAFYRYRIGQILLLQRIRNKIAADLHDDIGSTLNSISIFSEVARKDEQKRDYSLKMIGESSRKIIESMSDIVWSINPENDSFDKIIFRMRSLTHNLMKAKKIDCTFASDDSINEIKLPMEVRRNFYLIFKEALNNLVKYSNASRASVLVSHERGSITCIVRDDGVGFDSNKEYDGNGLTNMKKRAEEMGALLSIESIVSKGTTIELKLKL